MEACFRVCLAQETRQARHMRSNPGQITIVCSQLLQSQCDESTEGELGLTLHKLSLVSGCQAVGLGAWPSETTYNLGVTTTSSHQALKIQSGRGFGSLLDFE